MQQWQFYSSPCQGKCPGRNTSALAVKSGNNKIIYQDILNAITDLRLMTCLCPAMSSGLAPPLLCRGPNKNLATIVAPATMCIVSRGSLRALKTLNVQSRGVKHILTAGPWQYFPASGTLVCQRCLSKMGISIWEAEAWVGKIFFK